MAMGPRSLQRHEGCTKPRVCRATSTLGVPGAMSTPGVLPFSSQGSVETPSLLLGVWSCYNQDRAHPGGPGEGLEPSFKTGRERRWNQKIIHLLRADGSLNKCPFSIGKLPQGMVLCKEKQHGYLRGQGSGAQGGTAPWEGGLAVGRLRAAGRGRQLAACRLP